MNVVTEIAVQASYLYGHYFWDGDSPDFVKINPSIIMRLEIMHREQVRELSEDKLFRFKHHSQPPGIMVAFLAKDEIEHVINSWYFHITGYENIARRSAFLLADLVHENDALDLYADIKGCTRTGLVTLGLARPDVNIRGVPCPKCGKSMLMYSPDDDEGDVYCGNGGPTGCHDDAQYVCYDGATLTCRRSAGSTRHGLRWSHDRLHDLVGGTNGSTLGGDAI